MHYADLPRHKMTEDLWYHALKFLDKYRWVSRQDILLQKILSTILDNT